MADEGYYDSDRYESAAGWDPTYKYKKERERIHAEQAKQDAEDAAITSLLTVRPAAEWMSLARRQKTPAELFGPLWREGEVAVLLGDHGAGKSILAVQLAEAIARGRNTTGRECARLSEPGAVATGNFTLPAANRRLPTGRRVLLIDFQRTDAQWTERYSAPSPILGKLPVGHRFPKKNFDRAGVEWQAANIDLFQKDPATALYKAIQRKIDETRAEVVIIDDLTLGGTNLLRRNGLIRTMLSLKALAATQGLSILALSGSPPCLGGVRRRLRGGSSASSPPGLRRGGHASWPGWCELADSIFSIHHSTFGPEYRYVKSIHHSALSFQHSDEVLAYQICRVSSPHVSKGSSSATENTELTESVLISTNLHPANCQPPTANCFLGLQYLGMSSEIDHLRDYQKEARDAERASSQNPRSAIRNPQSPRALRKPKGVVNMLMSKEYWRYLDE